MNRTPPKKVRKQLRQEVGFGCPIPNCGVPYLEWHHFDPPWRVHEHHNPSGMIALCAEHHKQADKQTWIAEQLRTFKRTAKKSRSQVQGRFEWMRYRLLGLAGGNAVLDTSILFYCSRQPIIWFNRDHKGYLKVNLRRPRTDRIAEPVMVDNDWVVSSDVADIECPPSGHLLAITYPNGDRLRVQFQQLNSVSEASRLFPFIAETLTSADFPLAAVEFQVKAPALSIDVGPTCMTLPGNNRITGCFVRDSHIGFAAGEVVPRESVAFNIS